MRNENNSNKVIIAAGVVLAAAVAIIYIAPKWDLRGTILDYLPALNAGINGTVTLSLILAYMYIRKGNRFVHQRFMTMSVYLSVLFLLSYVTYHVTHETTNFGGEGLMKYIYYFILLSHILLAMVVAPMVLLTYVRAMNSEFDRHRKLARITFPLWLYVSITGVLVYLLISPYYS